MAYESRIQRYKNHDDLGSARGYDLVQPKLDGYWARVEIAAGTATIFTRQGRETATLPAPAGLESTLVGECLAGTARAVASADRDTVVVFDCLAVAGEVIAETAAYTERLAAAAEVAARLAWARPVETLPAADAGRLWRERVETGCLEGIVLRRAADRYTAGVIGRIKRTQTADYLVLGVEPGRGKLAGKAGAIILGLLDPATGIPLEVCRCGTGLADAERAAMLARPESYVGRVVEVRGHDRYPSGALRHPTFSRWRADKAAADCVMV